MTTIFRNGISSVPISPQLGSVTKSCPALWDPWTAARQASLPITNSWSSLRLESIKSVMPSSHLTLCCPLLLLPLIFPSIRVFSHQVHAVRPCDPAEQVSGANLTQGVPCPRHLVMLSSVSQRGAAPCGRQEVASES